jgi:hypothetical protein
MYSRSAAPAALAFALCGCSPADPAATHTPAPATFKSADHGHTHERGKLKLADAGHYHAALTAHLSSKDGNELDVFFETADAPPKPVPLPFARFTATATTADGTAHVLEFKPAPPDERAGDPAGACSHFVAKAGWMKPTDALTVTARVTIHDKPTAIEWADFDPKKYAHHDE